MLPFENCPDLLFYPFPADPQANMYRVRPYKPADKVHSLLFVVIHTDIMVPMAFMPVCLSLSVEE